MANITDQFVTSFSELYIGNKKEVGTVEFDTASNVRSFFAPAVLAVNQITLGVTNTISDGTTPFVLEIITPSGSIFFNYIGSGVSTTAVYKTVEEVITAGGKTDGVDDLQFLSAKVPLVMEIGSLSNEATVIDTPTFGEVFKGKLRGQLDGGQLDAQLYWAPRSYVHLKMREYAQDGTEIVAGIKWKTAASGGDSEFVVFDSFVSSFGIDTTFDDVAKVSSTLVVDGAEYFASED